MKFLRFSHILPALAALLPKQKPSLVSSNEFHFDIHMGSSGGVVSGNPFPLPRDTGTPPQYYRPDKNQRKRRKNVRRARAAGLS